MAEHNSWYDRAAWHRKREQIKRRDNYLCQHCLRENRITPAYMVHHIKPLADFPEVSMTGSNLVSLCNACHEREHERRQKPTAPIPPGVRVIKA